MSNDNAIYRELVVVAIIDETPHSKTFELNAPDGQPFHYEAGQFITLVFKKADHEDRRSYSFSSAPLLNEPPRITVKRIVNGEYSRQLTDHLKIGDRLISSGISGFFRLTGNYREEKAICFLAAGSGITPVYSLIKTILFTSTVPVLLLYSNPSEGETIYYQQLLMLQEKFGDRIKIEFLFSHPDNHKRRLSKWLLLALLKQHHLHLKDTLFYLCGPAGYMLIAGISLITAGVPGANIKKENFNTRKHIFKPVPPDTNPHAVKLSINRADYTFTVQYPDTILATAKKLHIQLPYSCEAGNCGSCTATCIAGKTWMAYNEVLTDKEIEQGKVLTCQGYPVGGDIEIRF